MNDLGRSLSRHEGTIGAGGWFWYIGGVLLVAGVLNTVRGLGVLTSGGAGGTFGTGLLTLVIAPLLLAVPILRWRQSLEIFEGGYVWTRLLGTKTVRKDQIRGVRHITRVGRGGTTYEIEVTLTGGDVQRIVGVDRADQAANMLAQLRSAAPAPVASGWQPPSGAA